MGMTSKPYEGIEDGSLDLIAGKRREGGRRGVRLFRGQLEWLARPGTVVDVTQPLPAIEFITLSARCLSKPAETLLQLIRKSDLRAGRTD
ncbi:hypothetical protein DEE93_03190 [Ralstonia pickettii]|uniref:Uncharacterized protein n=2 Tax=Burkholderiaceae TaxID=119060 RepID=A0A9Q2C817_RALPI|nr:hypothetical protein [Ralstonia pickettii]MBA9849392.1 hypothetical protein [Ralstonia pickettii]MBA9876008.1 hypothetical protein [Ralstonia pickettii]MBA9881316.1 hypothetical protein [Ralstonia pickettii]MBA9885891.1 hypothetical protein [Ralstonia pickettii]